MQHCTVAIATVETLQAPLKTLYDNCFRQMAKYCSSDRDNSVVIFIHWTRTVNHGKSFRASLTMNIGLAHERVVLRFLSDYGKLVFSYKLSRRE